MKWYFYILVFILVATQGASAQRVAISSDPLRLAMLTPNIEAEVTLSPHITVSTSFSAKMWGKSFTESIIPNHIEFNPEFRYWFVRTLHSHYASAGLKFISFEDYSQQVKTKGSFISFNVTYGYAFMLSKRCNVTPYVGYGVSLNSKASKALSNSGIAYWTLSPVEAGVALTYIIN